MKSNNAKIILFLILFFLLFLPHLISTQDKKSIAVAKFDNVVGKVEDDWIGTGFSETLTNKFAGIKSITVIERMQLTTIVKELAFQQSGIVDIETAKELGKALGCDYMVIGSYQKVGDYIKVLARVVNIETAQVLEAGEVGGKFDDIFKLQEDLAFKLISAIELKLTRVEEKKIKKEETISVTAYEYCIKGRELFYTLDPEGNNLVIATEYFKKAIELDENYALAYSSLAVTYATRYIFFRDESISIDEIINYGEKAVKLNISSPEAHIGLGFAYIAKYTKIWDGEIITKKILPEMLWVIKLRPESGFSYLIYWLYAKYAGDEKKAKEEQGIALSKKDHYFEPHFFFVIGNLASMLAGKEVSEEEFEKEFKLASEKNKNFKEIVCNLIYLKCSDISLEEVTKAIIYAAKGFYYSHYSQDIIQAENYLKKSLKIIPKSVLISALLADIHNSKGEYEKAIKILKEQIIYFPNHSYLYSPLGFAYWLLGDLKSAEENFKKRIAVEPNLHIGYSDLGIFYYENKKYNDAILMLQKALELYPDNTYARLVLSLSYFKTSLPGQTGKFIDSEKEFNSAEEIIKNKEKSTYKDYYYLSVYYNEVQKDCSKAKEYLKIGDEKYGKNPRWDKIFLEKAKKFRCK